MEDKHIDKLEHIDKIEEAHDERDKIIKKARSKYHNVKDRENDKFNAKIKKIKEKAGFNKLKDKKHKITNLKSKSDNIRFKLKDKFFNVIFKLMPRKTTTIDEKLTIRNKSIYIYNTSRKPKIKTVNSEISSIIEEIDSEENRQLIVDITNKFIDLNKMLHNIKVKVEKKVEDTTKICKSTRWDPIRFELDKKSNDVYHHSPTKVNLESTSYQLVKNMIKCKDLIKKAIYQLKLNYIEVYKLEKEIKYKIQSNFEHLLAFDEIEKMA